MCWVLTRAHLAVMNIQSALRAEGPRLKAGVSRIVCANRIIIGPTISRAILLILLRFLGRFDGVFYIFRRGRCLFDILRLLYILHGGINFCFVGKRVRFLA